MNKAQMLKALEALNGKIKVQAKLLLGGGGAMVLAYQFPVATADLDALFYKSPITDADVFTELQDIATALNLPKDWLNPHFGTFLFSLPKDYESRLRTVYKGKNLEVNALGPEDLLILKCFAGREKDISHAKSLVKLGVNIDFVQNHIHSLIDKSIPNAQGASDFLDDLLDEMDV